MSLGKVHFRTTNPSFNREEKFDMERARLMDFGQKGKRLLDQRECAFREKTQQKEKNENHSPGQTIRQHTRRAGRRKYGRLHEQGDDHFEIKIDGENDG
jgi:hypothetical protein